MNADALDVCVIGHITRDIVHTATSRVVEQPGGVPYYAGLIYANAGLRCAVITKLASTDRDALTRRLSAAGVTLRLRTACTTAQFENIFEDRHQEVRSQWVHVLGETFVISDLSDINARAFHLGPLTNLDMDSAFIAAVAKRGQVYLDAQGMVRRVVNERIQPGAWEEQHTALRDVYGLKINSEEARMLCPKMKLEDIGAALSQHGPKEVVITGARQGAMIWHAGIVHHIDAVPVARIVDATGCGDAFFAGYITGRRRGEDVRCAGQRGMKAARMVLERHSVFAI